MKALLTDYVTYNLWANRRLLDFILDNCNDEQLGRELISSFNSLRKTWLHIWGAESVWLMRLKGESPQSWIWMEYTGSISELRHEILLNNEKWIEYIHELNEEDLRKEFTYKTLDGSTYSSQVSAAILHCNNHSTFHRGQVITLLRQLGFSKLVPTDFIAYLR